jgi:phosphomannomutase
VGVYILPQAGYYPESIFAALTMLGSIRQVSDIRSFLATLPPLFFFKDKIACANENKGEVMAMVRQQAGKLSAVSLNDLDGLRFEFGEGWLLIRASGTEPAIRVLSEAGSEQHARSLLNMGLAVLKDAAKGGTS